MENSEYYRDKCTIVVLTHDDYEDCWAPFFCLLKQYWPDNPFPIVLNTENKEYFDETLEITVSDPVEPNTVPWGKRVRLCLEKISTEYVLIFLEDFFLEKTVDNNRIYQCINWMDYDQSIVLFSLYRAKEWKTLNTQYEGFVESPIWAPYRSSLQLGIWRRRDLLALLEDNESPWEFEIIGNERTKSSKKKRYFAIHPQMTMPIYYNVSSGIKGGKWIRPIVEPLLANNGILVEFNKRGFMMKKDRPDCYKITKYNPRSRCSIRAWFLFQVINQVKSLIHSAKVHLLSLLL